MGKPIEAIYKSNTTQNVLLGVVAGGLTAEGVVAFIHTVVDEFGGTLPDGYDGTLFYLSSVVLIPLASRLMAHARGWGKKLLGMICVLLCVSLSLSGCMTGMPAVAGKTKVETVFLDRVDAQTDPATGQITSPGQTTEYRQKAEVPAGVDIKGVASMAYDWGKDGYGHIAIAQDGSANTVEQAKMLPLMAQIQAENTRAMMEGFIGALAPILSTYVGNLGQIDLYNAQNPKTDPIKEAFAQALSQALQQQASSEDATGLREMIRQLIEAELDRKTAPADSASK